MFKNQTEKKPDEFNAAISTSSDEKPMTSTDEETAEVVDSDSEVDEVFGKAATGGTNYKTLGWKGATVICLKIQLGLGILSIPSVLQTLGAVPAVLGLLFVAILTTWADIIMGQSKLNHRELANIVDFGTLLSPKHGKKIRDVFLALYILFIILVAASAFIALSTGLNVISNHGACTLLFTGVVAIAAFLLGSIQTLSKISILGWGALLSIILAVLTLTIGLGASGRPALAPASGFFDKQLRVVGSPSLPEAVNALSNLLFAYAGTPTFLGVIAEMKEPKHFVRAVVISQAFVTAVYLSIGISIWFLAGIFVASPSLSTAGPLISKISYGLAIPGLLLSSLLFTHISAKALFIRIMRNSKHLSVNTTRHYLTWLSCVAACAIIAFLFASAIPIFGDFVGLVAGLLASFFVFILPGAMWLFDNGVVGGPKKTSLAALTILMIIVGVFYLTVGSYGSGTLIQAAVSSGATKPFSCA